MSGTGRPGSGRRRRGQPAGRDRRRGVAGRRLPWQSARGRGQRGRGVSGRSLPGPMQSGSDELAGKGTFPGRGGRVRGERHDVGTSRRSPSESGPEPKTPPPGGRALQDLLITSSAEHKIGAADGEEGHRVKINFPMAYGRRENGARLGMPVLAQPAQLLGPAPDSRQVHLAIAHTRDANTVSAGVGATMIAPQGVPRLHEEVPLRNVPRAAGQRAQMRIVAPGPSGRGLGKANGGRGRALGGTRSSRRAELGSLGLGAVGLRT